MVQVKKFDHLRIRLEDIMLATNNFNKFVSELVCFDKMYLSLIDGKNTVELPQKKYTVRITRHHFEEHELQNVIETLSKCEHRNIESFLGFCEKGPETILVFEHVSLDNLFNHLEDRTVMWKKRLEICVDIAHGLEYLHSQMEDQKRVIRSDIRALTIVLNDNRQAVIVGLQKAIFLPPNQDDGAIYLKKDLFTDPEYATTGKLTIKSDVYSFGVVMLQILCGHRVRFEIGEWIHKGIIKEKI